MKKVLALMLAMVLALSLAACGGSGNSNSEEKNGSDDGNKNIALTLDNYQKYLNVSAFFTGTDEIDIHLITPNQEGINTGNGVYSWMIYQGFSGSIYASAVSQNFNYEDIEIKGKVKGKYEAYSTHIPVAREKSIDFEQDFTLKCNIAGEATQRITIDIPDDLGSLEAFLEYDVEVDSITGYVSPVGK